VKLINWQQVSEAIEFYKLHGYSYVEVPWIVSDKAVQVTLPEGHIARRCQEGALVGSAEQSFIQMMVDGSLKPGKYVAASPCFRDDPVDEWHQTTFFKVELINFSLAPFGNPIKEVKDMLLTAADFFWICGAEDIDQRTTTEGLDIYLGDNEIGSYGYRTYETFHWIYGTGYADPRFSQALQKAHGSLR
jgi:hypothetical protein